ncbi:phage virion morphogenesis protein [Lysobacter sp. CA199]|uniref:phage virion morphogenesis protein n=1 Tax=Lysobacter sp. CA199 TaxID=3455608 RepID=UPI003F8D54B5
MAGARIEFDRRDVDRAMQALTGTLGDKGRTLLFKDIGEYLLRSTRERAATQRDPNGKLWETLSPPYKARKQHKRPGVPILKFDFHMLGDQFSYQVIGSTLYVGTNAIYGATHQFGRDPIPARPWLGLSKADHEEIPLIVKDHVMAAFGR